MVHEHDIVQIHESHKWGGCLLVVTEVKSFGVQGYVRIPLQGDAFLRISDEDFTVVGRIKDAPNREF